MSTEDKETTQYIIHKPRLKFVDEVDNDKYNLSNEKTRTRTTIVDNIISVFDSNDSNDNNFGIAFLEMVKKSFDIEGRYVSQPLFISYVCTRNITLAERKEILNLWQIHKHALEI